MGLETFSGSELNEMLARGETSSAEVMQDVLATIAKREPELHAFLSVEDEQTLLDQARAVDEQRASSPEKVGALNGLPVAVKDSICTQTLKTTAASRMLEDYVSPFDATVVARIRAQDGIVIGKTNLDEFCMGSSTENSAFGPTKNPINTDYVPGGTSGGSAAAIAANETIYAIGSDTGGSIRQPASFCGCVGYKPTYGAVSRYGLIAYASSLDQIGTLSKNVADSVTMASVICGFDPRDSTSLDRTFDFSAAPNKDIRFGVPKEIVEACADAEVAQAFDTFVQRVEGAGYKVVEVGLPHSKHAVSAYYVLACSEASSNLQRYTGTFYGHRADNPTSADDMITRSRSEGFGPEVMNRILLGAFCLSEGYMDDYYGKAQRIRRLVSDDLSQAFEACDYLLHPVSPVLPFKLGEKTSDPVEMYNVDTISTLANMGGVPAISLPMEESDSGLPIGMQLTGPFGSDAELLACASALESACGK